MCHCLMLNRKLRSHCVCLKLDSNFFLIISVNYVKARFFISLVTKRFCNTVKIKCKEVEINVLSLV